MLQCTRCHCLGFGLACVRDLLARAARGCWHARPIRATSMHVTMFCSFACAGFASDQCPEGFVAVAKGSLRILAVENVGEMFNQKVRRWSLPCRQCWPSPPWPVVSPPGLRVFEKVQPAGWMSPWPPTCILAAASAFRDSLAACNSSSLGACASPPCAHAGHPVALHPTPPGHPPRAQHAAHRRV